MYRKFLCKLVLAVSLVTLVPAHPAKACSWAAYVAGSAAFVARTMDWYVNDPMQVQGMGRGVTIKAASTANALEYTTKYATIQMRSFDHLVGEVMNEAGLQACALFLDGSRLPKPSADGKKDFDPMMLPTYVASCFSTVAEALDHLKKLNFLPGHLALPTPDGNQIVHDPQAFPTHFAMVDKTGDKAIVEFVKGEMLIYHGKEHDALSNEPAYEIQMMFRYYGYRPYGSISTPDRFGRAKDYLNDMRRRGVDTSDRGLLAMRGLIASLTAGMEEIDPTSPDEEVYPTMWSVIADLNAGKYYVERVTNWCAEVYDFSMFDVSKPQVVNLKAQPSPIPPTPLESGKKK